METVPIAEFGQDSTNGHFKTSVLALDTSHLATALLWSERIQSPHKHTDMNSPTIESLAIYVERNISGLLRTRPQKKTGRDVGKVCQS